MNELGMIGKVKAYLKSNRGRRRVRGFWHKLAITLLFVSVTCGLGACMHARETIDASFSNVVLAALFFMSVVANGGWFFYVLAPYVRKRLFNAFLFVGLFLWGCVLYYYSPVHDGEGWTDDVYKNVVARQIEAPNRSIAAFFPSRGGFEAIPKDDMRMHYFLFHSAVLFYVAMLTFAIFGRGIVNRIDKWLTRWNRLNVFWGRSDAGLLLARDLLDTTIGDQVFFALQQRSGDGDGWRTLTKEIDSMGATWAFTYDSNAVETDVDNDTLAQTKGRRHFFMEDSGHLNLSRADRLVKVLREKKPKRNFWGFLSALRAGVLMWWVKGCRDKPFFYVRVETIADEFVCLEWAANVRDVVTPVLVRESSLTAKRFIASYPMLSAPGVEIDTDNAVVSSGAFRTLLIGFGSTGQEMLKEIVCNGQFLGRDGKPVPFSVDVVEMDKDAVEEFRLRHPEVGMESDGKHYNVKYVEGVRAEDESFDKWFMQHLDLKGHKINYNRIVVCLNSDDKSLSIASKVVEFSRRFGIIIPRGIVFARVKDPARNRYMPCDAEGMRLNIYARGDRKEQAPITLFGNFVEVYSFAGMNVESVDRMAKVLNSRHGDFGREVSSEQDVEKDWDNASIFDQISSRASAEGQRNLLQLLGWKCVGKSETGYTEVTARQMDEIRNPGSGVLLTLAETEHLRWNAFHRMRGYRVWDILGRNNALDDLPPPLPEKIKANQLELLGKHADLVPFSVLPDVDMQLKAWALKKDKSTLNRMDFEGLKEGSAQAWDIAFCQIMDKVADAARLKIVETRPR